MRTLQEWMQYMEERKRRAREAEAPGKQKQRGTAKDTASGQQGTEARSKSAAPARGPARRVVSRAEASTSTYRPSATPGIGDRGGTDLDRRLGSSLEKAREQVRRALQAREAGQAELPLGLPPADRLRRPSRSADESRDELIERLLDPTLTLQETAKLLNVCPTTVRRYTNRGVLDHFRTPGNQRRFRLSDVLEFMRRQQES